MSGRETDANRQRMLAEVRRIWIDGYLKDSLHNLVRIELGLEEKPDAVSRPWDLIVQQPDQVPRPLSPGQAMGAVFDELGQALLILGAPGAGKTTLLLELTRDLLDRAEQDATHPIPVVFHLSSWAVRRRSLVDWLVDELVERYYVPRKLSQAWTDAEQVLPLLDGLDEIAPEHRAACVEAINTFRCRHQWVPLAVCSRTEDYEALRVRVELSGAVVIRPLSRAQVSSYLKEAGKPLAGVRTVLRDDETLWNLLETPLMLSIVALAYQGRSAAEVRATGSLEQRRTHLFENYTRRMFERRSKVTSYTREQTLHWLTWLARSLTRNNLSVFYLEWMQPDWLQSRAQRLILVMVSFMVSGLVTGGLIVGLAVVLKSVVAGLIPGPAALGVAVLRGGLLFGLAFGLAGALLCALGIGLDQIKPAEVLKWSWAKARIGFSRSVAYGALIGLLAGLLVGLLAELPSRGQYSELFYEQIGSRLVSEWLDWVFMLSLAAIFFAEVFGLLFGLAGTLVGGLTTNQILIRTSPNEGIRRSFRNALISLLTGQLFFGLLVGLPFGLRSGLLIGSIFGLLFGLRNGGFAVIKHYVLRILLRRNNFAPWNYIRFLDYAVERVFLRKVGGGYIFTHRLLMEYFATLQPTPASTESLPDASPTHRWSMPG